MAENHYIDVYCERIQPGLWDEPINALTNISFIIAGIFALKLAHKQKALRIDSSILIALMFAIGIGSTLFHTFATLPTMFMDIIPILLFQLTFIGLYARNIIKLTPLKIGALYAAFFALSYISMQLPRAWLNGSLEYLPAFIFVASFAAWHIKNAAIRRYDLLLATLIFIISLSFRSIDMALCSTWPIGTHFMWHSLNGLLLYLCFRAYIFNSKDSWSS